MFGINSNLTYQNNLTQAQVFKGGHDVSTKAGTLSKSIETVSDRQGFIGRGLNTIKKTFKFGTSSAKCYDAIDEYKKGNISYEEVKNIISKYERSQSNSTELISNILTGVVSIAVATKAAKCGNIGWFKAIAKGSPIGALVKTGVKTVDRATNNIEGDTFNSKDIIRDAVSGAVTGMTSAVSSNVGEGIKKGSWKLAVKNGTISGVACGAAAGGTSYLTDVALSEDKKFNMKEFSKDVASSAFFSGTVGGVVGAGLYGISAASGSVGANAVVSNDVVKTAIKDSASSTSRKLLNRVERDILSA